MHHTHTNLSNERTQVQDVQHINKIRKVMASVGDVKSKLRKPPQLSLQLGNGSKNFQQQKIIQLYESSNHQKHESINFKQLLVIFRQQQCSNGSLLVPFICHQYFVLTAEVTCT